MCIQILGVGEYVILRIDFPRSCRDARPASPAIRIMIHVRQLQYLEQI
jgi:hypothetical protein